MATLTRWRKYVPRWLGNAESADPFAVEVKRATWGERRAFIEALRDDKADEAARVEMFSALLRGPMGDLVIDGERITTIEQLVKLALAETDDPGNLFAELVEAILEGSALGKAMRELSAPASGGRGTSAPEAAHLAPTAPAVDASSPVVTTSSGG